MKFKIADDDTIFLNQLLKASGLIDNYQDIRHALKKLQIKVNGRQIRSEQYELKPGDEVTYRNRHVKIISKSEYHRINAEPEGHVEHGSGQKWTARKTIKNSGIKVRLEMLVKRLHDQMIRKGFTLSLAESCTGGLVQQTVTSLAGSSAYFLGGVVSYSNEAKIKLIQVRETTLEKHGAVSEKVAKEMAVGVQRVFDSYISGSVTGIAGPEGGTREKPVGTVHIAARIGDRNYHKLLQLDGNRDEIRIKSAVSLIELILNHIKNN
jgi:nicotinamide-nucleotide amidase